MFIKTVPDALARNLESLGKEKAVEQFYLAGGTALALQLGHRLSYDLDFFTEQDFSEKKLTEVLQGLGELTIDHRAEDTLLGFLNGARISFFWYRYPLLFPPVSFLNMRLADIRDIGAMKLDAIQSRGKKRDFIDLWAIMQHGITIGDLLGFFEKKYAGVSYNTQHIMKSLVYFADAEQDEMPRMFAKISWKDVKKYIEDEVREFVGSKK
ncbi:MAG: nucleotidyl transferase AbiEii/AbiGii toxin family protein [Candidatus Sungbacteria bacterium]|nr:nucleotidyl transferase AbiEii/AbiGii toxin family protein [Candidatus Sungbacteria bacterium]